nr:MAG TPA: hypothetical protein [Caudoviricetes sp.]
MQGSIIKYQAIKRKKRYYQYDSVTLFFYKKNEPQWFE